MIHVRTQSPDHNDQPVLHLSLVGIATIEEFNTLLSRALNCADPQKHKDWVEVSDKLQVFIAAATPI